jgi:hypothetical protein
MQTRSRLSIVVHRWLLDPEEYGDWLYASILRGTTYGE